MAERTPEQIAAFEAQRSASLHRKRDYDIGVGRSGQPSQGQSQSGGAQQDMRPWWQRVYDALGGNPNGN